jgi:hypothetical protein
MMADDPWAGFQTVAVGKPAEAVPAAPSDWSAFEPVGPEKKAAPAAKPVKAETPPVGDGSVGESVNALTGGAVRGVPIVGPYLDAGAKKAAAGVRSLIHGTPYDDELKAVSEYAEQAAKAHPALETTGEIAGGVGTLLPLGLTGVGARAMGITGPTMAGRMALGGATGGALGGVDAAVRGHDIGAGTGLGTVLGVGAPVAGRVAGSLFESLANRATRPNFAGSATTKVERAIADDALTPQAMQARLAELGPEGMLADVGPNLRSQAEAIASTPGPGQRVVLDAVQGRTQGAPGRITNDLNAAMGGPVNPTDEIATILQRRQQQAAPLYRQAYQQPVQMTQDVADVLSTPAGQQAIRRAERLALNEGGALQANVRGLDLVQRALDDMASTAGRAGRANEARIIRDLHGRIVSEVEGQVPAWRAARQLYRSESATAEALDAGRNIFSRAVTPDELAAQMRGMSHAERDAFTQGARAGIADIMGSARNDANAARALFEKGWTVDKLNSVIGPQATTRLVQSLQREGTFFGTATGITGNSRTAARTAAGKEFPSGIGDPHVPTTVAEAAMYIPRKIANAIAGSTMRARAAQQGGDAARALTATGADRDEILRQILAASMLRGRNAAMGANIGALTTAGVRSTQPALSR